jgi:hypothetical protein
MRRRQSWLRNLLRRLCRDPALADDLGSIVATILSGLATGIAAPLRLRHAGLMTLAAAVVTLWTALQSLQGKTLLRGGRRTARLFPATYRCHTRA